jgi:hypothetical protein
VVEVVVVLVVIVMKLVIFITYTRRKYNVLTYWKNNRLELGHLLVQLAEKMLEY